MEHQIRSTGKFADKISEYQAEIAELKGKLGKCESHMDTMAFKNAEYLKAIAGYKVQLAEAKDKLHRRNMQIKDLKAFRDEALRLSALLGRLGYDLRGNKNR